MSDAALISADWGTTALRIYLLTADGRILDKRASLQGITSVANGGFADVLRAECAGWLDRRGALPVLLSGMVGSRQGWLEAPYVSCPTGLAELAANTAKLEVPGFSRVEIVAGVDSTDAMGIPDVMRGEECQIMGALSLMGLTRGTFVLPGTHSKWVTVEGGRITDFRTFMTGEIFAALKGHTILGRMMAEPQGNTDGGAFARGVDVAGRSTAPGEWLHRLFSVRTLGLMGKLADADAADYLSGLMIGWELASMAAQSKDPLILIGSRDLTQRYHHAARLRGVATAEAPEDCVCAGHIGIARAAAVLPASI